MHAGVHLCDFKHWNAVNKMGGMRHMAQRKDPRSISVSYLTPFLLFLRFLLPHLVPASSVCFALFWSFVLDCFIKKTCLE